MTVRALPWHQTASPMRFGSRSAPHPAGTVTLSSRLLLLVGFGGLLLLMSFAGFDSIRTLGQIQKGSNSIREDFLSRSRVLEQIRSDFHFSGTYVRDYLLEPENQKAEGYRLSLLQTRSDMDALLARYSALVSSPELKPFHTLTQELADYWQALDPVLHWTATERHRGGYAFLRDEVSPRRTAMLQIAEQISRINESQLNASREKVIEIFARFRQRLVLTVGLTVGVGLLLAAFSMGKILHLEAESAARYQEIATARADLKQLSARLVEAQENERRSISRELHDAVGQTLTGIRVELANLSRKIRSQQTDGLDVKVDEIKEMVDDAVGVVRNMALLLRPSMLDDLGLIPALQWQAREVSKRTGVRVKIAAEDVSEDLPEEHKTCIYRVVQEALHNCVQHSEASMVRVTVNQETGRILLVIQDDGKGFDTAIERGMGLLGIEERVSHLGGTFSVESRPGAGAILFIVLPLGKSAGPFTHDHEPHPNSVG